ncbi:MAG: AtpZ/AtpI family protein [Rhodospirillaceae bacterium]|nr:AtpZ/AtpI family protein [Rhodospirillales bacterium]
MAEQEDPQSFDDIEARIRAAREREATQPGQRPGRAPPQGLALGMRLAVEFVAGVAIGVGLGYVLDRFLGTAPWMMVLFLLLGGAAGVFNAYRAAKGLDATVGLAAAQRRQAERQKDR